MNFSGYLTWAAGLDSANFKLAVGAALTLELVLLVLAPAVMAAKFGSALGARFNNSVTRRVFGESILILSTVFWIAAAWVVVAPFVVPHRESGLGAARTLIGGVVSIIFLAGTAIPPYVAFKAYKLGTGRRTAPAAVTASAPGVQVPQFDATRPTLKFKDIYGMSAVKARLKEVIEEHKTEGRNGIMLAGDPGNGKTMFAEAIAGEMGYAFMSISIADTASKWMGEGPMRLSAAFAQAASMGKVVFFIDEADSLIGSRDRGVACAADQDDLNLVNTFLTGAVNLRKTSALLVVATNFSDKIDTAAARVGRIDFKIEVTNPDFEARLGLLKKFSGGIVFDGDVLNRLARRWEGYSTVMIRSTAEEMARMAKKERRKTCNFEQAMQAIRKVQGVGGEALSENTMSLSDMVFPEKQHQFIQNLVTRMQRVEDLEAMGGKLPKGVLFYGAPGTGKTSVAKAIAKASEWNFLQTTGQKIASDVAGFQSLIKKARAIRPVVVFVDEIDSVLQDRSSGWKADQTNAFLTEMDGASGLQDVMFIGATNRRETLDDAAVRGGRFSEHLEFVVPERQEVQTLVEKWLKNHPQTPFSADFTADRATDLLLGLSQSDIVDRLQQAVDGGVSRKMRNESQFVELEDLRAVLSRLA